MVKKAAKKKVGRTGRGESGEKKVEGLAGDPREPRPEDGGEDGF